MEDFYSNQTLQDNSYNHTDIPSNSYNHTDIPSNSYNHTDILSYIYDHSDIPSYIYDHSTTTPSDYEHNYEPYIVLFTPFGDSIYEKKSHVTYVLTCIIISIGLPSTLLAISSLVSQVRNDHVAPIYVINLLISDLIQLCYMIVEVAAHDDWHIPYYSTLIYFYCVMASVGFMVCVALERFLVIVFPLWYRFRRTIKTSLLLCVVTWLLPLVWIIPYADPFYFINSDMIFSIFFLLPFPLLIIFLVGTLKALCASVSVPSDEKRRIVGMLVLVLLIYTLLFLPGIIFVLTAEYDKTLLYLASVLLRLSPLADLLLYFFLRKGIIDKLLARVCCCRKDSNDVISPSV